MYRRNTSPKLIYNPYEGSEILRKISSMKRSLNSVESNSILKRKGSNDSISSINNRNITTKLQSFNCNSLKDLSRHQTSPTASTKINSKKENKDMLFRNNNDSTKFNPRKSLKNLKIHKNFDALVKSPNSLNFKSGSSFELKGNNSEIECYEQLFKDKTQRRKSNNDDNLVILKINDKISVLNTKNDLKNFHENRKKIVSHSIGFSPNNAKSPMLEKKLTSLNKEYYESIKNSSIKIFLKSNQNKTTINNELDTNSKTNRLFSDNSSNNLISTKKAS